MYLLIGKQSEYFDKLFITVIEYFITRYLHLHIMDLCQVPQTSIIYEIKTPAGSLIQMDMIFYFIKAN